MRAGGRPACCATPEEVSRLHAGSQGAGSHGLHWPTITLRMHLVQLFIPVTDNAGQPFPPSMHAQVRQELLQRFGGLTAYQQAPASGLWREDGRGAVDRDELIVVEVMVRKLERPWWRRYRAQLEARLGQRELLVRAQAVERL